MFSQPALVPGLAAAQAQGQALLPQQRVPSVPRPKTEQTMVQFACINENRSFRRNKKKYCYLSSKCLKCYKKRHFIRRFFFEQKKAVNVKTSLKKNF